MRWPCCGTAPLIMALFERKEAHSGQRFRSDPQRLEKSYLTNRSFSEPWVFQPIRLIGVQAMSKKSSWVKKRHSDSARAKAQQRHRRKRNLLKKAAEFSLECESDVFLAVRIQTTGQIHIFDSSSETQWLNILSNMVRPMRACSCSQTYFIRQCATLLRSMRHWRISFPSPRSLAHQVCSDQHLPETKRHDMNWSAHRMFPVSLLDS